MSPTYPETRPRLTAGVSLVHEERITKCTDLTDLDAISERLRQAEVVRRHLQQETDNPYEPIDDQRASMGPEQILYSTTRNELREKHEPRGKDHGTSGSGTLIHTC